MFLLLIGPFQQDAPPLPQWRARWSSPRVVAAVPVARGRSPGLLRRRPRRPALNRPLLPPPPSAVLQGRPARPANVRGDDAPQPRGRCWASWRGGRPPPAAPLPMPSSSRPHVNDGRADNVGRRDVRMLPRPQSAVDPSIRPLSGVRTSLVANTHTCKHSRPRAWRAARGGTSLCRPDVPRSAPGRVAGARGGSLRIAFCTAGLDVQYEPTKN